MGQHYFPAESLPFLPKVGVILEKDGLISVANTTLIFITWETEIFDPQEMFDKTTNPNEIVIKQAGYYIVFGSLRYDNNATGIRTLNIAVNDVNAYVSSEHGTNATADCTMTISGIVKLAVNDGIGLTTWQNSGGSLNLFKSGTTFSIWRIS